MGGIVGDAFGSPYQFRRRGTFAVTPDMEPCDNFSAPAGSFTDDSSMMLCLARSLAVRGAFDAEDQMDRYERWLNKGYMSSMDRSFDVGSTTMRSIQPYANDKFGNQTGQTAFATLGERAYGMIGERYRGNGGIMRLAPVVVWALDEGEAVDLAVRQCAVTHADPVCTDCAAVMARVLWRLMSGAPKDEALDLSSVDLADLAVPESEGPGKAIRAVCRGEYKEKSRDEVSTSGYVVDTLEAALWALWTTDSYEEGVMTLAAMGDDADTTCCVFGQLAGPLYTRAGGSGSGSGSAIVVPERWSAALARRDLIDSVIDGLLAARDQRAIECIW